MRSVGRTALLELARSSFETSARLKRATIESCHEPIADAAEVLIETLGAGGKVLCFGNGGSAADAQHLAAELAGRFVRERRALPALALGANSSDLTAIANDYGFEQVFARLVEAHGRPGDVAIAISTSGNSPNVNAAVRRAHSAGLHTIAMTGNGGGELGGIADTVICVPSDETPRIQESHIVVCHVLCELVDAALFPLECAGTSPGLSGDGTLDGNPDGPPDIATAHSRRETQS